MCSGCSVQRSRADDCCHQCWNSRTLWHVDQGQWEWFTGASLVTWAVDLEVVGEVGKQLRIPQTSLSACGRWGAPSRFMGKQLLKGLPSNQVHVSMLRAVVLIRFLILSREDLWILRAWSQGLLSPPKGPRFCLDCLNTFLGGRGASGLVQQGVPIRQVWAGG